VAVHSVFFIVFDTREAKKNVGHDILQLLRHPWRGQRTRLSSQSRSSNTAHPPETTKNPWKLLPSKALKYKARAPRPKRRVPCTRSANNTNKITTLIAHTMSLFLISAVKLYKPRASSLTNSLVSNSNPRSRKNNFVHLICIGGGGWYANTR